jgi:hypothetical protein
MLVFRDLVHALPQLAIMKEITDLKVLLYVTDEQGAAANGPAERTPSLRCCSSALWRSHHFS